MTLTHKLILLVIFLYLGISLGIPGVTLIYIEKLTTSREDEVALIFSSRAVGSLAGWLLGLLSLDLDNFEPTTLMSLGTFGLFITHLLLPWAVQLWWVFCGFTFQGALMAITIQGCLAFLRRSRPKNLSNSSHQLVFACLLGCVICPFIVLPFFRCTSVVPEHHGLNSYLNEYVLQLRKNISVDLPVPDSPSVSSTNNLRRQRRSALFYSEPPFVSVSPTPRSHSTTVNVSNYLAPSSDPPLVNASESEKSLINETQNISDTRAVTALLTTTSTTAIPKKPSVIDAKHLNQDASSADGSNTAVKMKQLGEERRIDTVAAPIDLPSQPPDKSVVIPIAKIMNPPTTTEEAVQQPSLNNRSKALASNETANVLPDSSEEVKAIHSNSSQLHTSLSTTMSRSAVDNLTTPVSSTTPTPVSKLSILHATQKLEIPNTTSPVVLTTTTTSLLVTNQEPATTPSRPHQRIVEHSATSHFASRFLFTQPLQPIQRVYYFLGALGLFTWLLSLLLTGWCRGLRCQRRHRSTSEELPMLTNNRSFYAEDKRPLVSDRDTDDVSSDHWLPVPSASTDAIINLSNPTENSDEDSLYVSAQELEPMSDRNSEAMRQPQPGKAVPYGRIPLTRSGTVQNADVSRHSPRLAQWPRISWPADAWLLLAEFFGTGIETAFSGFVHGFTVRYLLWTPSLAFVVNSLFWLGGLVGRLPCLFLLHVNFADSVPRTSSPVQHSGRERTKSRSSVFGFLSFSGVSTVRWPLLLFRIFGGLVCAFSAVSLARFSLSSESCTVAAFSPVSNPSPRYLSWLGGSLFLGLGIGMASSTMSTMGVDTSNDQNVHRLQLAGHIGQLVIPAALGYVHHLAAFWRYACMLSTMVFILSLLMTLALCIDLFGKQFIASRSPNGDSFASSESNSCEDPGPVHESDVKSSLSPIALHVTRN